MENTQKVKILIVEDEETLASILKTRLLKEGYNVLSASNGVSGFNSIKNWKPDLILLDIIMPKMDGYEVLKKMNEENIKIPVIIISNSGQAVEIEKTKKLGAIDHLIKTQFDPEEVLEKISNYLNNNQDVGKGVKSMEYSKYDKLSNKILLVEDDSFLREICAKKLTKEGFAVHEVIDGEQALNDIEKINPDLVLLDVILPTIDGFEVLGKIRASKNKKISKVPVIMLSNLGQESDIKKAMDLGANNYLIKAHFTTEEITNKIKKELNIK